MKDYKAPNPFDKTKLSKKQKIILDNHFSKTKVKEKNHEEDKSNTKITKASKLENRLGYKVGLAIAKNINKKNINLYGWDKVILIICVLGLLSYFKATFINEELFNPILFILFLFPFFAACIVFSLFQTILVFSWFIESTVKYNIYIKYICVIQLIISSYFSLKAYFNPSHEHLPIGYFCWFISVIIAYNIHKNSEKEEKIK